MQVVGLVLVLSVAGTPALGAQVDDTLRATGVGSARPGDQGASAVVTAARGEALRQSSRNGLTMFKGEGDLTVVRFAEAGASTQHVAVNYDGNITNPYRQYIPGTVYIYEAETEDGLVREEVHVLDETRSIEGVDARVVWVREWLSGELYEETYDFYAQDDQGNVYYLGEDTTSIEQGRMSNKKGSWEVGQDAENFGLVMPAHPQVGQEYHQETSLGKAEDMGTILAVDENIKVRGQTYTDCVKVRDWSKIEGDLDEIKYYCPEVGNAVLIIDNTEDSRSELIEVRQASP